MKNILYILIFLNLHIFQTAYSQCPPGKVEVSMTIHTGDTGPQGYWQIVPFGNQCGTGTVAEGGNLGIGCAGNNNAAPGGYGNNQDVNVGPWCLDQGVKYDLIYIDVWGEGGFTFDLFVNSHQIEKFMGMSLGAAFNFTATEPSSYDLSISGSNLYNYVEIGMYHLQAHVFNKGSTTINSYDLNYTVDGGAINKHPVAATALTNYSSETVEHSIPISIPTSGVHSIKVWADNLNASNIDQNTPNDTLKKQVEAGPGRPVILDRYVNTAFTLKKIAGAETKINAPTDLDFHPVLSNKELWVCNKETEDAGGSTVTIYRAGEPNQASVHKVDGNAWHFMSLPTALAFSQNGNWAIAPGVYDANHNGGAAFTGPSLWSSDMAIYAQPSGGNGSHLDMLHESPYCQGIASEKDNVFWVFDGHTKDIVRYDFVNDHGPGNSYHGDAIIRRYSDDEVAKDPNDIIVSHMIMDEKLKWLYVVDHGHQRVIRIDITTGSNQGGAPNYPAKEMVMEYSEYTGYTQETVVAGLNKPAGIDVIGNRMIISEYERGEIILYDISTLPAKELERIQTGLSSVQGIKIGPDGFIWFVDQNSNGVYHITPIEPINGTDELALNYSVYPNPASGEINIVVDKPVQGTIHVCDVQGKLISISPLHGQATSLQLDVEPGIYFIRLATETGVSDMTKILIHKEK